MTTWADLADRTWGSLMRWQYPLGGGSIFSRTLTGAGVLTEFFFGADLTADPSAWIPSDVTPDVRVAEGVDVTAGRADEAPQAQPSTCKFSLQDQNGDYTPRRALSPHWPYMRRDLPVRFSANDGSVGLQEVWSGFVDTLAPGWDESGKVATVDVSASGILRRLGQGDAPLKSVYRRRALDPATLDSVAAYWPCEDETASSRIASGLAGGPPMVVAGVGAFATFSLFGGSAPLFSFGPGVSISGPVPTTVDTTGAVYFRTLLYTPSGTVTNGTVMIDLVMAGGAVAHFYLRYVAGGQIRLQGVDADGTTLADTGNSNHVIDDAHFYLSIELVQSGPDIDWLLFTRRIYDDGSTGNSIITGTFAGLTVGRVTNIVVAKDGTMTGCSIGHIGVANTQQWLFSSDDLLTGFAGESAHERIQRLCDEERIPCTVIGVASEPMGLQTRAKLLDLLRECETTDGGVLGDGVNFGITYRTRESRYNQQPVLQLNVAVGELAPPLMPADDDQRGVNDVTAKRGVTGTSSGDGSSERVSDEQHVIDHGRVDTEITVNTETDAPLLQIASWALHLGTSDAVRYPTLNLDMGAAPTLIPTWLVNNGLLQQRLTATNLPSQAPDGGIDVVVEGWTQHISAFEWLITANCAPYEPWRVAVIEGTGEPEMPLRWDAAGSTLTTTAAVNATSLTVATTTGSQPWTTDSDDFPFDVEIAGIPVTVSSISGTSSPQAFAVVSDTVIKELPADSPVVLYRPAVIAR